jgi:hypothetical protein
VQIYRLKTAGKRPRDTPLRLASTSPNEEGSVRDTLGQYSLKLHCFLADFYCCFKSDLGAENCANNKTGRKIYKECISKILNTNNVSVLSPLEVELAPLTFEAKWTKLCIEDCLEEGLEEELDYIMCCCLEEATCLCHI